MKNLIQRTIFGAVYIATIIAALTLSEWVFLAVCVAFTVFGIIEFYNLSNGRENVKLLPKVLDVFGGSGSTLVTCEQLNRRCYTMELEPKWVDVIIDRWEQQTGQKAVLVE